MSYQAGIYGVRQPRVFCNAKDCESTASVGQGRDGPQLPKGWRTTRDDTGRRDYCPRHATQQAERSRGR